MAVFGMVMMGVDISNRRMKNKDIDFIITKIASFLIEEWEKKFLKQQIQSLAPKHKCKFKMYDDDGVLYFQGLSTYKDTFEPLDFFGIDYGCTKIKYFKNGKYHTL